MAEVSGNPGVNEEPYGKVPMERIAVGNAGAYTIADDQKIMPAMKRIDFDPSSRTRNVAARNATGMEAGE